MILAAQHSGAGYAVFAVFVVLMLVLAVFVVRFAHGVNRRGRK